MTAWRGGPTRPEGLGAGLTGSVLAHALALLAILWLSREVVPAGTVYAVRLVAAPATPPTRRAAPEAIPRPVERTAPVKAPTRTAKPSPTVARSVPQPQRERAATTASTEKPNPGETPSTGTHVANVDTPGQQFPYPEYLERIVNEIYRRWERPGGTASLRAQIQFAIQRDGTVREIRVVERSRSYSFDLGARGAVEAAANAKAFGPLPEGFKSDVLQIALWFVPRGAQ